MRVLVIVKANADSEAGKLPTRELLEEMGRFNEELVHAGVMVAGEGLHPSSRGARVRFDGAARAVVRGPFAGAEHLVAGFWIWKVRSLDDAIDWLARAPFRDGEVELRPILEAEDFGAALTPELREREEQLRAQVDARH